MASHREITTRRVNLDPALTIDRRPEVGGDENSDTSSGGGKLRIRVHRFDYVLRPGFDLARLGIAAVVQIDAHDVVLFCDHETNPIVTTGAISFPCALERAPCARVGRTRSTSVGLVWDFRKLPIAELRFPNNPTFKGPHRFRDVLCANAEPSRLGRPCRFRLNPFSEHCAAPRLARLRAVVVPTMTRQNAIRSARAAL